MLLIGSHAAKSYWSGWESKFLDYDYITTYEDAEKLAKVYKDIGDLKAYYPTNNGNTLIVKTNDGVIADMEIAWPGTSGEMILNSYNLCNISVASPWTLYLLKMSHRYKKNSPHFLKTMKDIHQFRAYLGITEKGEPTEVPDWYKLRVKETYSYAHPKLNTTSKEFFKPEDNFYVYDHDWIHEVVALDFQPAYLNYQVDGEEVLCSKDKFYSVDPQIRLNGVYEEACVLALERSQIPHRGKVTPERSFKLALEKVCTSITSGWFREFAWEHYHEVMAMAIRNNYDYSDRFFSVADTGRVKLFTGSKY